jgi:glycosyltransferase involved in cell wall biosynthesis
MSGLLVPAGSPEALTTAMLDYFVERSMARRHGRAARQVAQSRFSLKRMVYDYSELYERSLAAAGIPRPQAIAPH